MDRRLSRRALPRAGDPLRGSGIGRPHHARTRWRLIDRTVGDGRRRRGGPQRRRVCGVADPAGIGQRSRIGGAERHAGYRRIAGAGRTCGRRQLRERARGSGKDKRHEECERNAGHRGISKRYPGNGHVARAFLRIQLICLRPPVKLPFYCLPSREGVGVGARIRPNHGATTF
jgi:hypothetical protein